MKSIKAIVADKGLPVYITQPHWADHEYVRIHSIKGDEYRGEFWGDGEKKYDTVYNKTRSYMDDWLPYNSGSWGQKCPVQKQRAKVGTLDEICEGLKLPIKVSDKCLGGGYAEIITFDKDFAYANVYNVSEVLIRTNYKFPRNKDNQWFLYEPKPSSGFTEPLPTPPELKCDCGAHKVWGKDCGSRAHSNWCSFKQEAEARERFKNRTLDTGPLTADSIEEHVKKTQAEMGESSGTITIPSPCTPWAK